MVNGLIGRKIGMTQVFSEDKKVTPVTVIQVEPCVVIQKKTLESDKYESVQLGSIETKPNRINKPRSGQLKKAKVAPMRHLKEFKADDIESINVGDVIKVDIFKAGDKVDVTGTSKGKGFAGVVKRHGFAGGRETHGSRLGRNPGAIGQCAWPGKTFRGKKLPGHMGDEKVTVLSLKVVDVKPDKNLILLTGAVPGAKNGIVYIRRAVKHTEK
jgi:large subunit ribosomal protein L3